MKRLVLLLVLLAPVVMAQQAAPAPAPSTVVVEQAQPVSYSDLYCAGFVTNQRLERTNFVAGGHGTPDASIFSGHDIVYLNGAGYQVDQLYNIVRELRDPNEFEAFPGQRRLMKHTGQAYADLGRVRILQVNPQGAVARIEFSCQGMVPGDLVIPFQERPPVAASPGKVSFDQFPTTPARLTARIILSKEFDMFVGSGHTVYVNAGSDQGVKPGDRFRVLRGYTLDQMDPAEALSYKSPAGVDTQKNPPKAGKAGQDLPRRALAEIVVLSVSPTASTAMITFALENVKVGDAVELEGPQ